LAIRAINKTGGASVKGYIVEASDSVDNAVKHVGGDDIDPMGIMYNAGVADGDYVWVVVSGIAEVYYSGNVTRATFSRVPTTGEAITSGQAINEALPSSPFATDKHFQEIGHPLESRVGAGLAKTVLHFN
ncbi:hypothetical protein KA005_29065, partial [bacterium]|nr:hypothetical protein [bacterium]